MPDKGVSNGLSVKKVSCISEFWSCLSSLSSLTSLQDCSLVCGDGTLPGCRLLLALAYPHLLDILKQQKDQEEILVLLLPDFTVREVSKRVEDFLGGRVELDVKDELESEEDSGIINSDSDIPPEDENYFKERAQNGHGQLEEIDKEGTEGVKKDNGWRFEMGKSRTHCLFCATNFATNEEYSSHILLHREGINWKCLFENCGRVMTKTTTLKTHMKRHRNEFNHHCKACTKKFVTKKAYDLHMRVHRGEFKHTCEQCGHKFVSDWGYRKHVKKHSDPKIPCHLCGQMLSDKSSMRKHIEFIHEGKKRYTKEEMDMEVMCQVCSKVFKGKMAPSTLQRHIKYVHMGGKHKVHNCEICGKGYQGKANLRQHVQVIHDQVYLFCDQCGAPFRSKTMLSSHIKIVHTAAKGQFHECTECQTEFLKQYQNCSEHENVKICEKCGYTTSHGDQLKSHQGSKHCDPERTLKRKLWCNLCSRGFTREKALKKHELEHIRGKAHKCDACGKGFTERFNLNKHLKKGLCKKTMEVQCDI